MCGKTVEVFLRDFNQPAAAAPFALAKGEGTKRGRQAMPVSLFWQVASFRIFSFCPRPKTNRESSEANRGWKGGAAE